MVVATVDCLMINLSKYTNHKYLYMMVFFEPDGWPEGGLAVL